MTGVVNPNLHREVAAYGAGNVDLCMNCGHCTAVCSISPELGTAFPRRIIHLLQVGREEALTQTVEPWLCYYCGDCSESCPRDARPSDTMMAARRWLTARYDWTRLAGIFYRFGWVQIAAILLVALVVMAAFAIYHGPVVTSHVALNTFAPVAGVELVDRIAAGILAFLLISNAIRMAWSFMGGSQMLKVPVRIYAQQVPQFISHYFTQRRWRRCSTAPSRKRWMAHLLLFSGYVSMQILVELLLGWFQTDTVYPFYYPQRLWGYYAAATLLYGTGYFLVSRWRKLKPMHQTSEVSDWLFVGLIFLVALTGILVHIFRLSGLPLATYITYAIHLAIAASLIAIFVPFGKWSHLLYRPLALYLTAVKQAAAAALAEQPDLAPAEEPAVPDGDVPDGDKPDAIPVIAVATEEV